jgi:beta-xylosidase
MYYLVATEMPNPEWGRRGIMLYTSKDLIHWQEKSLLIDHKSILNNDWFKGEYRAPEIHELNNKFYLTFSANNQQTNPYGQMGICVAVSESIDGQYNVLTNNAPLILGNNFTLLKDKDQKVYAYWDVDGRFYGAEMNADMCSFKNTPTITVAQNSLNPKDNFMDSPSLFQDKGTYYLLYSVFNAGYRLAYATAKHPLGPWKANADNVVFYRSEDQASIEQKMPYSKGYTYAPPCEIIGQAHLLKDANGSLQLVYHSEDKYAEPFLCIDKAQISDEKIMCNPTLK